MLEVICICTDFMGSMQFICFIQSVVNPKQQRLIKALCVNTCINSCDFVTTTMQWKLQQATY